jgi:hypothetical protein
MTTHSSSFNILNILSFANLNKGFFKPLELNPCENFEQALREIRVDGLGRIGQQYLGEEAEN